MAKRQAKTVARDLNVALDKVLAAAGKPEGNERTLVDPEQVASALSPPDSPPPEPSNTGEQAYKAYREWEDQFRWTLPKELGITPDGKIKFRTAEKHGSGVRVISEKASRKRIRQGKLPLYLFSNQHELEGVELISSLPGAPDEQSICPFCRLPLFGSLKELYFYLRDVLEDIVCSRYEAEQVPWRTRHVSCTIFQQEWLPEIKRLWRQKLQRLRMTGSADHRLEDEQFELLLKEWGGRTIFQRWIPEEMQNFFRTTVQREVR